MTTARQRPPALTHEQRMEVAIDLIDECLATDSYLRSVGMQDPRSAAVTRPALLEVYEYLSGHDYLPPPPTPHAAGTHSPGATHPREEITMEFEVLSARVAVWARERGILQHSTPQAQLLKAVSELGELCDAEIKDNQLDRADAIGDVLVCLINYCAMRNLDLTTCLADAYAVIKDRKGRMVPGGAFVKEADEPGGAS